MQPSPLTLLACCDQLTVALVHRDICWLNQGLAVTAKRHSRQGIAQTKYDWIDAIQNENLTYTQIGSPTHSQVIDHCGRVQVEATMHAVNEPTTPVFLQLTFIWDHGYWQLSQERDLSKKPIDWIG